MKTKKIWCLAIGALVLAAGAENPKGSSAPASDCAVPDGPATNRSELATVNQNIRRVNAGLDWMREAIVLGKDKVVAAAGVVGGTVDLAVDKVIDGGVTNVREKAVRDDIKESKDSVKCFVKSAASLVTEVPLSLFQAK